MTERVEEIRRRLGIEQRLDPEVRRLIDALAQAEREREAMMDELANLRVLHEANCHYKTERDNTRAEVERLKGLERAAREGRG